ncbi:hypothetical protein CHGG_08812 [Chaetomium globosum CBS 148.51]|uniref:Uncharacterized protein n=1 Tax=Chaetomium globosum (strain ATCC 6205 / CBS 148.51 / DSM 1962 / NBRC 6347 / NRRL 1970) TaxID=306901 RepID=Q2GT92_CHAGB|nr:uncharacterized protein CHGG_08812 [Chaetomium globosum CBS 148.51]EAQ84798.1 hypothetical protein CHGG_08812 [Chaetomium globosum CBS 148.51]
MAPLANTTDNSGWFPPGAEPSEGWHVDAVTLALLAIIGDARSEDLTRAMTATRLAILPRLVPAMQLLSAVRPARLPRANATLAAIHGPIPDEVFRKKTIGYFVNVLHGMDDMQRLGFRVLEVKHNTQKKNQDLESANVKFASVPPSRLVRGVLIFSSALTLGLFIAAIAWQNGPAALAVAFMGISSSLMSHASSWRPGLRYGALMATGSVSLMLSILMLGNCSWRARVSIALSYIVLNLLYWIVSMLPRRLFWDMSRYIVNDVTPSDALSAHEDTVPNPTSPDERKSSTRTL